jgi:hypothetical protein
VERHHILHCQFVVRGLTAILMVGGLGVEDGQKGLWEVPIISTRVASFCTIGPKKEVCLSKIRPFDELEQYIIDTFASVPFGCLRKSVGSMFSTLH